MLPDPGDGWHPDNLSFALGTDPQERAHPSFGQGQVYSLGNPLEDVADLTVYPEHRSIHYRSRISAVGLYQVENPRFPDDGVIFHARSLDETASLYVTPSGDITVTTVRLGLADDPARTPVAPVPTSAAEHTRGGSTLASTANCEDRARDREPARSVNIVGRALRRPTLTSTHRGDPVARFPLVQRVYSEEGEHEVVHTITVFRDRARQVSETVKLGQAYRAIGYPHEYRMPGGETIREIYAAAVRPSSRNPKPLG